MKSFSGIRSCAVVLVSCVLLAACGTAEKPDTNAPTFTKAAEEHVPTSVSVSIAQMKFHPEKVSVHRGDTIVFTNNDVVDHDATALPDSSWTSGPLHPGDSWKLVADSTSEYFCSIHVVMRGEVIVE